MNPLWAETARRVRFDRLRRDAKCDVLIIGGGMAGIMCAFMCERAGIDYMLVESDKICGGNTRNTTAKITAQHGLIYDKLINKYGLYRAGMYLEANQAAVHTFAELCRDIDCDFEHKDNFVYSTDDPHKIEKETSALDRLKCDTIYKESLPIPLKIAGAVGLPNQAQFHPLKFIYAIAPALNIYEETKVFDISPEGVLTNGGKIKAQKIIVATHFPFLNLHGSYFAKMYQHRSYVLALRGATNVDGMYVDEAKTGMSFRNHGDFLLLGGGGHRTGKQGGCWQELEAFAAKNYPAAKSAFRWAAQDCESLDHIPYIGQYSSRTPNLFVATGFNKWGMTTSVVAAKILTDLVQEKHNPYAEVFSPSRSIMHPQLLLNLAETTLNLLTPTAPRCPHLGCALKYNKAEHSWDCPCHGSRFSKSGKLLDNPATGDKSLKIKKNNE